MPKLKETGTACDASFGLFDSERPGLATADPPRFDEKTDGRGFDCRFEIPAGSD